jgi:hypothetical protein
VPVIKPAQTQMQQKNNTNTKNEKLNGPKNMAAVTKQQYKRNTGTTTLNPEHLG